MIELYLKLNFLSDDGGKKGPSSKAARGTEIHEFEIATCSAILNHFLLFCVFGLFEAII